MPAGSRYEGDFLAWQGGCAMLAKGGGPPIAPHAHYAVQLAMGAPSGLRARFGRKADWVDCTAALFPSRTPHTIDTSGVEWSAVIFVEPETLEGRVLNDRLQGKCAVVPREEIAEAMAALGKTWLGGGDAEAVRSACAGLVRKLTRTMPREVSDPRVLQAIEHVRERLQQPIALEEVAAAVQLSPSRFRHLFVEETGMPLRTYVLWRRLLSVWQHVMAGETLSGAAHLAGFADSAHLSRTSRNMFGLPPSAMQLSGPLSLRAREQQRHFG